MFCVFSFWSLYCNIVAQELAAVFAALAVEKPFGHDGTRGTAALSRSICSKRRSESPPRCGRKISDAKENSRSTGAEEHVGVLYLMKALLKEGYEQSISNSTRGILQVAQELKFDLIFLTTGARAAVGFKRKECTRGCRG